MIMKNQKYQYYNGNKIDLVQEKTILMKNIKL